MGKVILPCLYMFFSPLYPTFLLLATLGKHTDTAWDHAKEEATLGKYKTCGEGEYDTFQVEPSMAEFSKVRLFSNALLGN